MNARHMRSAAFALAFGTTLAQAAIFDVSIQNFAYNPTPLSIGVGDTVRWTNNDPFMHTVDADDLSFDSPTLMQNDVFEHTFSAPGTVAYHCDFHSFMHGEVNVVPEPASLLALALGAGALLLRRRR